jgi:hypothetical protein
MTKTIFEKDNINNIFSETNILKVESRAGFGPVSL